MVHYYVATANTDGFASAVFVVQAGESHVLKCASFMANAQPPGANKLQRPVAGGKVMAGVLKSQVTPAT